MESISERLKAFARAKGCSVHKFEMICGLSNAYIANVKDISSEKLQQICDKFPELNVQWLLTGEGSMYIAQEEALSKAIGISTREYLDALKNIIDSKSSLIDSLKSQLQTKDEQLEDYRAKVEELTIKLESIQKRSARQEPRADVYDQKQA